MSGVLIFKHGNGVREKLLARNAVSEKEEETVCLWPLFQRRKSGRSGQSLSSSLIRSE
ncbi:hypothetical protein Pmar_PMAR007425 [Perkinsus marinus ATCC 50983]|uniref:Uncharacterized protein n=1 Tax=Perkinsus marinus (strain ATCC 50983 / TXsc) TaxID=423536 RepID=C5L960_PERM5|nr:hypothetical protein Pmar_PMAR007425 [Perkinsus marinus ATCC 50983]EER06708.1 hypothetical protein Pmar_PMAR007425 [Perkinsus marinus ATCC 50983]|eukprot:XP_002774892.1 hypothetical protein Pmar_PMAR007425 [Perkinsus marinus ATCC 50983]